MSQSIYREYTFEAAHRLTQVPFRHKCARLHGHSWRVRIFVEPFNRESGELDAAGMVCDFDIVDRAWQPIWKVIDHNYLNEVDGLENPTSENVAKWIYLVMLRNMNEIGKSLDAPSAATVRIAAVEVQETPKSCARYEP